MSAIIAWAERYSFRILVVVCLLALFVYPVWLFVPETPPIIYRAVPQTHVVKAGGHVLLQYEFIRNELCQISLDRFLVRAGTNDVIVRERLPGGVSGVGDMTRVFNRFDVPDNTAPGKYDVRVFTFSTCARGFSATVAPTIQITVE